MTSSYADVLSGYLADQRWFAGKGRQFTVQAVAPLAWLTTEEPRVRIELVTVGYDEGDTETYQVPLAYLTEADPELTHALIGPVQSTELGAVIAYDAVFVASAAEALLRGFRDSRTDADLAFCVFDEATLPEPDVTGTVIATEQSNTSIAYGEDALLKLFRRVGPGVNPDVEISAALTRRGDVHIPRLLGWLEGSWSSQASTPAVGHLGMLQAFLRTATDGWVIALASVRDLFVEEDLHPDEVGGDFAGEAERLGAATAEVHADLAEAFATSTLATVQRHRVAAAMADRLDAAVQVAPELEAFAGLLHRSFADLAELDEPLEVQRIHGDLHLGQTLRTVNGWTLIDFEGEPAKPLAERVAPDSPLRDLAGMLRSFDYAAGVTLHQFGNADYLRYRGDEWSKRNRAAFLAGYASVTGHDPSQHEVLLRAYETDKAVYEVVYEARNRPHWLPIPLHGIERLVRDA